MQNLYDFQLHFEIEDTVLHANCLLVAGFVDTWHTPHAIAMAMAMIMIMLLAVASAGALMGPDVDRYAVTFDSPSDTSFGAMPLGNGRTSANTWVDSSTGDVMLNIGLADALDENSNLLKLGIIRVRSLACPPATAKHGMVGARLCLSVFVSRALSLSYTHTVTHADVHPHALNY